MLVLAKRSHIKELAFHSPHPPKLYNKYLPKQRQYSVLASLLFHTLSLRCLLDPFNMPGPRRTASQIFNSHGHGPSEKYNSHEPRRKSPRNPKPSLRVRKVIETLGEDGDMPLQLGKKKRSRLSELRTMEESSGGALFRGVKRKSIPTRNFSDSAMNLTKNPESKQQEASHTS